MTEQDLNLRDLAERPFDLLRELERRAIGRQTGRLDTRSEWVGVGLRLGSGDYVVPRDEIREVMMKPTLTRVPGAGLWLLGLANVRGQLIPIVDLKVLAGMPATTADRSTRVILVNDDDVPLGVLVDEVYGFRRFIADDKVASDPGRHAGRGVEAFVDGAFRREGDVWPVLSFRKLLINDRLLGVA